MWVCGELHRLCHTLTLKVEKARLGEKAWLACAPQVTEAPVPSPTPSLQPATLPQVRSTVVTSKPRRDRTICLCCRDTKHPPLPAERNPGLAHTEQQSRHLLTWLTSCRRLRSLPGPDERPIVYFLETCPAVMAVSPPSVPGWVKPATAASHTC